ncbi:MAG: 4-hydroxy-tetrahydrodipicolinate reductase [Clostridia bacterium]|nr:4-hydroxy-tetrahydrodipicolinate reductase [Clostridia bacterium]
MKFIVNGAKGRMGAQIVALLKKEDCPHELLAGVDINATEGDGFFPSLSDVTQKADCIIDFSHHSATREICDYATKNAVPVLFATTGQTPEELEMIKTASSSIPVFVSANMSVGIAMLANFAKMAVAAMPDADVEIVEKHHNRKLDAPSGTALLLANEIKKVKTDAEFVCGRAGMAKREKNEIGIHAIRGGGTIGVHEIIITTDSQTITLSHEAHTRELFAEGAISAAAFVGEMPCGFYNMYDMIK